MTKAATISKCGTYRYSLTRQWDDTLPWAVFVMLNPSTADAKEDDPTIRRCIGFARSWGMGTLRVVNLFGLVLRSTKPVAIWGHKDPVGPENDIHLLNSFSLAQETGGKLIVAWGAHGSRFGVGNQPTRDKVVLQMIHQSGITPYCLGMTLLGAPRHPLYIKGDKQPERFGGHP